jgi:predicted transcriptional regulator
MSHAVTIHLNDAVYTQLQLHASAQAKSPAEVVFDAVEKVLSTAPKKRDRANMTAEERAAARARFERHIGAADLGYPTGVDNESIDADLAREYADTHDEP